MLIKPIKINLKFVSIFFIIVFSSSSFSGGSPEPLASASVQPSCYYAQHIQSDVKNNLSLFTCNTSQSTSGITVQMEILFSADEKHKKQITPLLSSQYDSTNYNTNTSIPAYSDWPQFLTWQLIKEYISQSLYTFGNSLELYIHVGESAERLILFYENYMKWQRSKSGFTIHWIITGHDELRKAAPVLTENRLTSLIRNTVNSFYKRYNVQTTIIDTIWLNVEIGKHSYHARNINMDHLPSILIAIEAASGSYEVLRSLYLAYIVITPNKSLDPTSLPLISLLSKIIRFSVYTTVILNNMLSLKSFLDQDMFGAQSLKNLATWLTSFFLASPDEQDNTSVIYGTCHLNHTSEQHLQCTKLITIPSTP